MCGSTVNRQWGVAHRQRYLCSTPPDAARSKRVLKPTAALELISSGALNNLTQAREARDVGQSLQFGSSCFVRKYASTRFSVRTFALHSKTKHTKNKLNQTKPNNNNNNNNNNTHTTTYSYELLISLSHCLAYLPFLSSLEFVIFRILFTHDIMWYSP